MAAVFAGQSDGAGEGGGGWGLGGSAALMHLSLASPGVDPGTPQGLGGDQSTLESLFSPRGRGIVHLWKETFNPRGHPCGICLELVSGIPRPHGKFFLAFGIPMRHVLDFFDFLYSTCVQFIKLKVLKVQCILASYALGGGAFVMHFSPIPRGFSGLLFDLENKIPGVSWGWTPGEANDKCIILQYCLPFLNTGCFYWAIRVLSKTFLSQRCIHAQEHYIAVGNCITPQLQAISKMDG